MALLFEKASKERKTSASTGTKTTSIQENMIRIQTFNHVSDKYDIIDVIGKGSMGCIYKVRIKPNKLGGSAFYPKANNTTNTTSTIGSTAKTNVSKLQSSFKGIFKRRALQRNRNAKQSGSLPQNPSTTTSAQPNGTSTLPPQPHYNDDVMNRHIYALKTIRLDAINELDDDDMIKVFLDELVNEMNVLRTMDHPNIIKAHEIFMTKPPVSSSSTTATPPKQTTTAKKTEYGNELLQHQHMCIALELCTGGNLYRQKPYQEAEAAYILDQILNAVRYMHDRGIVHRDLKFENVLFTREHCFDIKILDFGLSKQFQSKKTGFMYERVGTIYTMAPEVVANDDDVPYTAQADVWSIGVMAYMLLSPDHTKPFFHKDFSTLVDLIQEGRVNFDPPMWDKSDTAKDFVQHLLRLNPYERYTVVQALQHPFIQQRDRTEHEELSPQVYKIIECSLQQYSQQEATTLKKLALSVIAHNAAANRSHDGGRENHSVEQLQKAFSHFDTEKNGILSYEEFRTAILQTMSQQPSSSSPPSSDEPLPLPYTEQELERIFDSLVSSGGMAWFDFFFVNFPSPSHRSPS